MYDAEICGAWMIDFAKTIPVDSGLSLDHRTPWRIGTHEDGYLNGLDHLILVSLVLLFFCPMHFCPTRNVIEVHCWWQYTVSLIPVDWVLLMSEPHQSDWATVQEFLQMVAYHNQWILCPFSPPRWPCG